MDELNIPHGGPRARLGASYRVQRRSAIDAGTRRLALISGGLATVLVLIVGLWSASGRHDGPIPVIQADKTPLRVKPDNPGGLQVAGVGDDVIAGSGDTRVQATAPAPEQPDPKALHAQMSQPRPAATPVSAPLTPAPSLAPRLPAPPPPPLPRPAAPSRAEQVTALAKGPQVQLGALSSEQAAREEWDRLTRRMPDLLSRRRPEVARAAVNGHVFWRLRTAGFNDMAQATTFCERVKLKGGDCSVAAF
jgi:cell division septation protein DedD